MNLDEGEKVLACAYLPENQEDEETIMLEAKDEVVTSEDIPNKDELN